MSASFAGKVAAINSLARRRKAEGRPDARFVLTRTRLGTHALLDTLDAPNTRVYHVLSRRELAAHHLAEPRVIKPLDGAAQIGAMVLHPAGSRWRDVRNGRVYTLGGIRERMRLVLAEKTSWRDLWLVEERLYPPKGSGAVHEFEVFVFGGVNVPLVRRMHAENGQTVRCWFHLPGWDVVDVGMPAFRHVPLGPPRDRDGVVELGRKVAAALPFAFARVDVFETSRGLVVGEVNDHIGYTGFNEDWDRLLGEMWDAAEQEKQTGW